MPKVKIIAGMGVVTSTIKFDDLAELIKFNPEEAGKIEDDQGNTLFRIGIGSNGISRYGIEFSGSHTAEDGSAQLVIEIPEGVEDQKAYIKDEYAIPLMFLIGFEKRFEEELGRLSKLKLDIENMFD